MEKKTEAEPESEARAAACTEPAAYKGDWFSHRGLGQAVVKFNGPMRAFLAVRYVDVCFQPESSGLLPTPGRLVADGAALS